MDLLEFLGGDHLANLDLPQPSQVWTVRDVKKEVIGEDTKIVVYFNEHRKGLILNKTNLRSAAQLFSTDSTDWIGRQLDVYKDTTQYQGQVVGCIRLRAPQYVTPATPQPVAVQGASMSTEPVPPPHVQAPATPWVQDDNSPPGS